MNHTEFFEKLNAGYVARGYLFTGEENFVKREALSKLEHKLLPAGLEALNESILEGRTADDIRAACETLPMLAERRLVVVRDFAPLMSGQSKNEKQEAETLKSYIANIPESTCLVMYMRGAADARKALYKAFAGEKGVAVVSFDQLDERQLYTWLLRRFKSMDKTIAQETVSQLIFRAGASLTRLAGEVDKLAAHAGTRSEITAEDLEIVPPTLECTVFQMIDRLIEKNGAQVFRMLGAMRENGEDDVRILAMITRQMRFMAHVKLLQQRRTPDAQIVKALGITPYGLKNTRRQMRVFTGERLIQSYRDCVNAEFAVKSGAMSDGEALGRLILNWLNT